MAQMRHSIFLTSRTMRVLAWAGYNSLLCSLQWEGDSSPNGSWGA